MIGFDMAQRMHAAGRTVPMLITVDTPVPVPAPVPDQRPILRRFAAGLTGAAPLSDQHELDEAMSGRHRDTGVPVRGVHANIVALFRYRPAGGCPRPMITIRALETSPDPDYPAPSWAAWNHAGEDCGRALMSTSTTCPGAEWIDNAGRGARDRLRVGGPDIVFGHCDWLAGNLSWCGDALYSTVSADELATVEDTQRFLVAYSRARGREFSPDELRRSSAAGVWTRAYDAKCQHAVGQPISARSEDEAHECLRRAARILSGQTIVCRD